MVTLRRESVTAVQFPGSVAAIVLEVTDDKVAAVVHPAYPDLGLHPGRLTLGARPTSPPVQWSQQRRRDSIEFCAAVVNESGGTSAVLKADDTVIEMTLLSSAWRIEHRGLIFRPLPQQYPPRYDSRAPSCEQFCSVYNASQPRRCRFGACCPSCEAFIRTVHNMRPRRRSACGASRTGRRAD
jgi:hypothetical protein